MTQSYFTPISFTLWQADKSAFAQAIGRSFRETGFAVITDHTLPQILIDDTLKATKDFFALPTNIKAKYDDRDGGGQRGYTSFGAENAKGRNQADLKEFWHTGRHITPNSPFPHIMRDTPRVSEVEDFDLITQNIFTAFDIFGRELLKAIALHLGLSEDYFETRVQHGNSILRLLHYPAQNTAAPEGTMRAAAHEDINVITLLLGAEEAGLQVKHQSGQWLSLNPPQGAVVVNCGDMLARLTAGILPSTTHRVLNPTPHRAHLPRYSMPYFLHFNPDVMITALENCVDDDHPAQPPISAQDYLLERLREIGLVKDNPA